MKLPLLSGKQVLSTLKRLGFQEVHRKGSHVKMKHHDGRKIVFPYHNPVDRFTLKGSLNDAEVDINDFIQHIKK
ncbi:MAG: type II toxin-antitoxin system HicA family toxin [Nitrospinae bacterium]|nr:type II toxin-antitoxin system HicA family toxin [Nitrospinota bacterium]